MRIGLKLFGISLLGLSVQAGAAEKEVSIAGWGGNDVAIVHNLINDVLSEDLKNAGVKINYQGIESDYTQFIINALSADTAPDAFYTDVLNAEVMIKSGKILPNDDELTALAKDILPNLNNAFTYQGKQYGIAKDFNTLAMIFNKDIFDEAEVEYLTNDESWDSLRAKLAKIHEKLGKEVTGICLMPEYNRFAPFALSTGWKPFNEQGKTVLDDNFKRAFAFYTSLKTDGLAKTAAEESQNWGGGCFGGEKAAIAIEGNWIGGYLKDKAPNIQYGTALMPIDKQTGQRGNLLFTVAWNINRNAKDISATKAAIKIMTSEKAQNWVLETGHALPSRAALANSDYFKQDKQDAKLAKTIFDGASNGNVVAYTFGEYGGEWTRPIDEALSAVLLGRLTVDQAIKQAQDRYDNMIK